MSKHKKEAPVGGKKVDWLDILWFFGVSIAVAVAWVLFMDPHK
jgi:hypothetical protein